MKTLRETVEAKKVRYHLGRAGTLVIRVPSSRTVQREDGKFVELKEEAIYLSRIGDGKMGYYSQEFDPSDDQQSTYMAIVDDWLAKNDRIAKSRRIWKTGASRPPALVKNWDNMDAEQIRSVMDATEGDLAWAMDYELYRPDGIREDVIDVLEDLFANGFESTIERSEEAPVI